jgi:hypothetical protein
MRGCVEVSGKSCALCTGIDGAQADKASAAAKAAARR